MKRAGALAAAASLALVAWTPQAAVADTGTCTGVWVQVGDAGVRCAPQHETGRDALESAGFVVAEKAPGFLCQIDAVPDTCTVSVDAHWSYWQAERTPDGTWGPWTYSSVGYSQSRPVQGQAEGWVLGDGSIPPPALPSDPEPLSRVTPPAPHDPGSPAATLATLGVVAAGGIGLAGWSRRRRHPA